MKEHKIASANIMAEFTEEEGDSFNVTFSIANSKKPSGITVCFENIQELEGLCSNLMSLAKDLKKGRLDN